MLPGFVSQGQGAPVILLHSSLSSSGQWRELMARLEDRYHCLAMDLYGYGNTPMPAPSQEFTLWHEVELLEAMLDQEVPEERLTLVGHSYGAAVALAFAQKHPERIAQLVLFEPVCFSILDKDDSGLQDLASVLHVFEEASTASDPQSQARQFIEYWNGKGAFDAMPERLQQLFIGRVKKVALDFQALMHPTFKELALKPLSKRLTLLHGEQTRPSALALIRQLTRWLPEAEVLSVSGGHMAPIGHADAVNDAIECQLKARQ
jgi:pimeloyl-ACP methyl ester carboxylesterase